MPTNYDDGRGRTLADYLAIFRRYKWLIIVTAVVVPLAAYGVSTQQAKVFGSTAEVLLSRQDLGSILTGIPTTSDITEPERHARTQAELARTPTVARIALRRAQVTSLTPEEFLDSSSVTPRENTDLLTFAVRDLDPDEAVLLATAYAKAFTTYKLRMDTTALSRARKDLQRRLVELQNAGNANTDTYRQLLQKAQDLRTLELLQAPASVVRPAVTAVQVEPRPLRNAVLGLMLGLMLGLGAALLLAAFDRRIRDAEGVERELGVPLLARVPGPTKRGDSLLILERRPDEVTEAVSRLRTNFDFANSQLQANLILVTSASAGEGKSTTVANLAIALARTGRHVVLVDLDVRRPAIARLFRIPDGVGVTDVATGRAELEAVLNRVDHNPVRSWIAGRQTTDATTGALEVITVGRTSIDPAGFVETHGLTNTLDRLRSRADIVLLDASPILTTGDAMALTGKVDAILLVNRLGTLTRQALQDLRRALQRSPAPTLGFVATGAAVEETYQTYRPEYRPQADISTLPRPGTRPAAAPAEQVPDVGEAGGGKGRWGRPST